MKICDICNQSNVSYRTNATTTEDGTVKELELCASCYNKLREKERAHAYQAYSETVEEVTGTRPPKYRWWNALFGKENKQ